MTPATPPTFDSLDAFSQHAHGAAAFAAFDPSSTAHRANATELHDRLIAIGFGPGAAAGLFNEREISEIQAARAAYFGEFVLPRDAAGTAARFFILHEAVAETALRHVLGDASFGFLADLAAIVPVEGGWRSLVSVTWFADRLIVTDARVYNVVWPGHDPFPDYVMPPGTDSIGLVRVAPRAARRATLDVCCGAGAQALAAAAYSERVVGVDVNPRALRFARFNAAANRIDGSTFVHSDCYESLGDARFDAILSNPPFVPWPQDGSELLFRGGGPRGDAVLARILQGAVERLDAGGMLAIVADFADAQTLPSRLRAWQGSRRRTLLLLQHRFELIDYAESHAGHLPPGARERQVATLLRHFAASGIQTLDFGYLLQDGTPGSTYLINSAAPATRAVSDDVAAWFEHERRLAQADSNDTPLALAPGLRLVCEIDREPGGNVVTTYFAIGAGGSLFGTCPLSATAFGLMERAAGDSFRQRDITDERESSELRALLDQGLLRLVS
jgi:carbamoyltransferase